MYSPLIDELIQALRCLPGVGAKSAQRMAIQVLERNRPGGERLARALTEALHNVGNCSRCRMLTEQETCAICSSMKRDAQLLCVVETPADMLAIEHAGNYNGMYFLLMGHLSPIDGIGPAEIGIDRLLLRLQQEHTRELILATNATVEGDATAYYITEKARQFPVKISRIARGVPFGGEIEYVDGGTLAQALLARKEL